MIGNDIVDLNLAYPGAFMRKRYLDKVFDPQEQRMIEESENPFTTFWLLWSMKESAYKAHFRKNPRRRLNPVQLSCHPGEESKGTVQIEGSSYDTLSLITEECIHTVAVETGTRLSWTDSGVIKVVKESSLRDGIIDAMRAKCADKLNVFPEDVFLEKDANRIPHLKLYDLHDRLPCSISHHGNFGAFAYYHAATNVTSVQA